MNVIDLHCDLLSYLALNPNRDPYAPCVRCSAPQLKQGGVQIQTLAISSITDLSSLLIGLKQIEIFLSLPQKYPNDFSSSNILPAFENASSFALEAEPLDDVLKRLESILTQISPLYISLTWNGENRFGGGCGASIGLKPDGEELLQFLSGRGIAIDFSHTSDTLARDLFNFIDAKGLDLPIMASHSNFRSVVDNIRNLPDDIAKEIITRNGIIGLVFYSAFLESPDHLAKMVQYGFDLGGEKALAFGSDFFCLEDLSGALVHGGRFFDEMSDASKYPFILQKLKNQLNLSNEQLEAVASKNALHFIQLEKNRC